MPPPPKRSLGVLFSVVVIDLVGFGIVMPILPFYADEFGASGTTLGLLLSCYPAAQFVFQPLWGRLSDRVGRRPVMLATIAGTAVALLLVGLADSLLALFAARTLGGAFAANVSVATAYITDVTDESERIRWMGMLGASFGVGFLLGPAIGGLLAPYGHAVPILVASGLAAVNLVHALFVLREPPVHREAGRGPGARTLLRSPVLRSLVIANLLFALAVTQLESMFAYFMKDRFGYDARQVAFILVAMAFVMVLIQGGGMRALAARYGERTLLRGGGALLALAFMAVPWMGTVALLLVPLLLAAVGRAVSQPALMSLASLEATPGTRGAVLGTFNAAAALARVFGPAAAGILYDGYAGAPFLLGGLLLVGMLGVVSGMPQPAPPERVPA
ncbi:MAG: MFS transporter [Myxococcota bacterium]|nr:MFS transporter [Myxococcota bacterium]